MQYPDGRVAGRGAERARRARRSPKTRSSRSALLRVRQAGPHPVHPVALEGVAPRSRQSYVYQDPVWDVIRSRFPISIFLGLDRLSSQLPHLHPAWRAESRPTVPSSTSSAAPLVFLGYSVPGWALGTALLVFFGGGSFWSVFPLGGFRPDNWEYLGSVGKDHRPAALHVLAGRLLHGGSFATLTILSKNSLMENLGQDYVRTAFAKGLDERRVIFMHALRNSLIPLVTGPRQRHQPYPCRLLSDRARLQHRWHGVSRIHGDPPA